MLIDRYSEKWQNATIIVRKYLTVSKRGSYALDGGGAAAPSRALLLRLLEHVVAPPGGDGLGTLGTTRLYPTPSVMASETTWIGRSRDARDSPRAIGRGVAVVVGHGRGRKLERLRQRSVKPPTIATVATTARGSTAARRRRTGAARVSRGASLLRTRGGASRLKGLRRGERTPEGGGPLGVSEKRARCRVCYHCCRAPRRRTRRPRWKPSPALLCTFAVALVVCGVGGSSLPRAVM